MPPEATAGLLPPQGISPRVGHSRLSNAESTKSQGINQTLKCES